MVKGALIPTCSRVPPKVFSDAGNKKCDGLRDCLERTGMKRFARLTGALAVIASSGLLGVASGANESSAATNGNVIASYNGGTIDLSQGWGTATICVVAASGTNCFANLHEYQAWFASTSTASAALSSATTSSCSSGFQLFENIDYGGRELIIYDESIWINLSDYSFNDTVSSYEVGACAVSMTDGAYGSGNVYPGATSPYSDVSWIGSTWNDRVSSVYVW